jgi:hypothetical protein
LKALCFITVVIVAVVLSTAPLMSSENGIFTASFVTGTKTGNLDLSFEGCSIEKEKNSDICHLLMNKPGKSVVKGTFTLSSVPKKLYFQINNYPFSNKAKKNDSEGGHACYTLYINDRERDSLKRGVVLYLINGFEISSFCVPGKNTFSIVLEEKTARWLWIRQIYVTPVGSFAEKVQEQEKKEGFFLHIPLYVAFFLVIAITISYLLFIIFWKNRIAPETATAAALVICGAGFAALPFLLFEGTALLYCLGISIAGVTGGILWILIMHR